MHRTRTLLLLFVALVCAGCRQEASTNSFLTWELDKKLLPLGLVLRTEDFFDDLRTGNPEILSENFQPEHLAYDIADDAFGYKNYTLETLCEGPGSAPFFSQIQYDDIEPGEIFGSAADEKAERAFGLVRSVVINKVIEEDSEYGKYFFLVGELRVGDDVVKISVPIYEEKGSSKDLRITYSIKPLAVG